MCRSCCVPLAQAAIGAAVISPRPIDKHDHKILRSISIVRLSGSPIAVADALAPAQRRCAVVKHLPRAIVNMCTKASLPAERRGVADPVTCEHSSSAAWDELCCLTVLKRAANGDKPSALCHTRIAADGVIRRGLRDEPNFGYLRPKGFRWCITSRARWRVALVPAEQVEKTRTVKKFLGD